MDKEEYFRQLYALNESSDDEQDTNDAREVIKQSAQGPPSSLPVNSPPASSRRRPMPLKSKKVPAIHRTTSAPVTSPSIVRETPLPTTKKSLRPKSRYDKSSPPELNQTFSNHTPSPTTTSTPTPTLEHSSSIPILGFQPILAMSHSTGIESMLKRKSTRADSTISKSANGKKRKRTGTAETPLVMVPESHQVFAGKTIFFIPNDDVAPIRMKRIARIREHGAVWVREWTPGITHVVVAKAFDFKLVMKILKPLMKSESIPSNIILVNEDYALECIRLNMLVDENRALFHVKGLPEPTVEEAEGKALAVEPQAPSKISARKSKKHQDSPEDGTQQRESQSQPSRPMRAISPGEGSPNDHTNTAARLESSRERSPILDMDLNKGDLGDMINLVQKFGHLPLEDDEDEGEEKEQESSSDVDCDGYGSAEEDHSDKKRKRPKKTKGLSDGKYIKSKGGDGNIVANNPNCKTIEILERLKEYYERVQDQWRINAYRRVVGVLKKLPVKISTYDEAFQIPHCGERLAAKIEEIVSTGRLLRLENAELDPADLSMQMFLKIYGVGPQQALKFIKAGYKTLDDLRANRDRLTDGQRIGLDHYDDFNTRIPRDEVTALGAIVKEAIKQIDPEVEAIIGGSYRRGAPTSGDIDFLLTKPGTKCSEHLLQFLYKLVDRLTADGFLTVALAAPSYRREDSGSKWHGACVLPGNPVWRRIDLLLVPETEFGAALIYFTGDDIFNRSLRLLARHKGMGLNQRGLYKGVMRDQSGKKTSDGVRIEGRDEREIFNLLGVEWRIPEHRICH